LQLPSTGPDMDIAADRPSSASVRRKNPVLKIFTEVTVMFDRRGVPAQNAGRADADPWRNAPEDDTPSRIAKATR